MKVTKQQFMDLQSLCWDINTSSEEVGKAGFDIYNDGTVYFVFVLDSKSNYLFQSFDIESFEDLYKKLSSFLPETK